MTSTATTSSHTRPPTDNDADHMLVRTIECVQGTVQVEAVCEPMFDYGNSAGQWRMLERRLGPCRGQLRRDDDPVQYGSATRDRGQPGACAPLAGGGRAAVRRARLDARARGPKDVEDAQGRLRVTGDYWRDWLASGRFPDHRWRAPAAAIALTLKGLTYVPTGAPSPPPRPRSRRRSAANATGTTATAGCATRRSRYGALHALGFDWEADDFMQFVADLERKDDGGLQIMYGVGGERDLSERDARRPHRVRGCGARPHRQRSVHPAPERPVRRRARLRLPAHQEGGHIPQRLWPRARGPGRGARSRCGTSPTRESGKPAASPSTTCPRS